MTNHLLCSGLVLLAGMAFHASASAQATALTTDTVTTNLPEGVVTTTYLNGKSFDNSLLNNFGEDFTFSYFSLKPQLWVTTKDNTVWMETPLLANRKLGYMHGKLSSDGKTITVSLPQPVLNITSGSDKYTYYVALSNADGFAGDTITNKFEQHDLVYTLNDNGIWEPREKYLLGLYDSSSTKESYAFTSESEYFTSDFINKNSSKYKYNYNNVASGNKTGSLVATIVKNGTDTYIKGFVPKYPDAWIYFGKPEKEDSIYAPSAQIVDISESLGNTYFFSAKFDSEGEVGSLLYGMKAKFDDTSNSLNIGSNSFCTLWFPDYMEGYSTPQRYNQSVLTHWDIQPVKPAAPSGFAYHSGSNGVEVKFTITPKDVDGNDIDITSAGYRLYLDDVPYEFTKADNPRMESDTTLVIIPWLYDDYYTISKSSNNRYVEFNNFPADTKTIGVEVVYTVNGVTMVSDRLVYDIITGKSTTTGIKPISAAYSNIHPVARYSIDGKRLHSIEKGINIIRMSDGTVRKVLVK